jgi:hypothetical protein
MRVHGVIVYLISRFGHITLHCNAEGRFEGPACEELVVDHRHRIRVAPIA